MKTFFSKKGAVAFVLAALAAPLFIAGCGMRETLDELANYQSPPTETETRKINPSDYYEQYYQAQVTRARVRPGVVGVKALRGLPKDAFGEVNWTASVVGGYIAPRPSLDPNVADDPPLSLNIFIEAKVPLMANVIFPHSIHTYWLSCKTCHPKIFIPEAGANPISMEEIFKGEWCGRCHNKVAFPFWPRENCNRCHIIPKGQSLEREIYH